MSRVLPILFNMEMVRAILDGRKSCTRRIIKPQPQGHFEVSEEEPLYIYDTDGKQGKITPPYQPGDILYVRETWSEWTDGYLYKAWNSPFPQAGESPVMKWHPSIHMPKEAARIWLKVTDVTVERLQEIPGEDLIKEGIDLFQSNYVRVAFDEFTNIWNSTIKKSDLNCYGWDANPWVWVIEFERCEKPKGEN